MYRLGAFHPILSPGEVFIVDPDDARYAGLADGANIATIYDSGGSAATLTETEGVLPMMDRTDTLNGQRTFLFGPGSSLYTTSGGLDGDVPHTLYAVLKCRRMDTWRLAWAFGQIGGSQSGVGFAGGSSLAWAGGNSDVLLIGCAPKQASPLGPAAYDNELLDTETYHLLALTYTPAIGSTPATRKLYVDGYLSHWQGGGVYTGSETVASPGWPAGLGFLPHVAGYEAEHNCAWAMACVGSAHDAATRWQVERHLRQKFGSSLGYPQANVINVVCLGDSVPAGFGLEDWQAQSFPAQLQQRLLARGGAFAGSVGWNQGIPGIGLITQASYVGLQNLLQAAELNVSRFATGLAPRMICVILAGINDLGTNDAQTTRRALTNYVDTVLDYAPNADTYVGTLPPNNYFADPAQWEQRRITLAEDMRRYHKPARNYFDLAAEQLLQHPGNPIMFQIDEVHPTKNGATVIADCADSVIR